MDEMGILLFGVIIAVVVIVVAVVILRADAERLRRDRGRYDVSLVERRLEPDRQPLPYMTNNEPRIVIGNGTVLRQDQDTVALQSSVQQENRIVFGSSQLRERKEQNDFGSHAGGIKFGLAGVEQEARNCPMCKHAITIGTPVIECIQCHTRFHSTPCWEEHTQQGERFCPRCDNVHIVSITA